MPNDADLIGSVQAAEIIGIKRSTLSRWVSTGRITPAMQLQGRTGVHLFRRTDVVAIAERYQPRPRFIDEAAS